MRSFKYSQRKILCRTLFKDMFIKHWQFFKNILQNWLMLIFYHFYNLNI